MRANGWTTLTVAEIISKERNALVGGPFGSDLVSKDYVLSGVPVIRGANMGNGRWVSGDFVFVSKEKAESLSANCAKPDDLVFTQRGTIGQVALVPKDGFDRYLISQSQMKLTLDPNKACALFLFYFFCTKEQQNYIQQNAIRTGVPHTNLGILRNTPVRLPSLAEQKAIASFLNAIDDKIELNQRINHELEGMAKLLYDYWFVQFDFPITAAQAAAIGKPKLAGKRYRESGGKMVYNDTLKREIPEGWTSTTLSRFANITMGQSPPGESYNREGTGMVFFQGATDFGWRYPNVREFTTSPSRLAKQGDILLSVRAPVGTLNIADQDCCIGRGLAALNAKSGHDSFLFEVMHYFKNIFDRRNSSGTTFGSITKEDLHSLEFACPSIGSPLLDDFEEKMKPLHKTILNNHQQNKELTQLRDWLLPMLMNGQISVG
jgi:type I restriction enzyme S subunit